MAAHVERRPPKITDTTITTTGSSKSYSLSSTHSSGVCLDGGGGDDDANDDQVRLTKFASLIAQPVVPVTAAKNCRQQQVISNHEEGATFTGQKDRLCESSSSLSMAQDVPSTNNDESRQSSTANLTTTTCTSEPDQKQLNMMTKYQRISFRRKDSTRSNNLAKTEPIEEDFKIVWRNLSFQVEQTTYDKLIDGTFATIDRFVKFAKGGARQQEEKQQVALASNSSQSRVIFENLNGWVNSGEISAILGPSGSGKTSLLNAICGRTDNYRGQIQLLGGGTKIAANGEPKKRRMRLSIIPQRDYLLENLTVRENLLYTSKILNTKKDFDHEENILKVVEMLNLSSCFESSVANISGGEYKRVSIGQELLRRPDILILDEPTSGLDSLNCKKLVQSLVQLIEASRRGDIKRIAIIVTIHQPDIDVFNMFDHVYCMAKGGRVIYDGHPRDSMQALRSSGAFDRVDKMPTELAEVAGAPIQFVANPANLLIEIASEDLYGSQPIERLARLQRKQFEQTAPNSIGLVDSTPAKIQVPTPKASSNPISQQFHLEMQQFEKQTDPPNQSGTLTSVSSQASQQSSSASSDNQTKPKVLIRDKRLNAKNDHKGHFWYHTSLLARRAFVSTLRDPLMTVMSVFFHLSIPFVMWTVYSKRIGSIRVCPMINREMNVLAMASNRTLSTLAGLQEELALSFECSTMFFLSTYAFSMCSLAVASLAFPLNMHILLKEVRNGWYNLPTFVVGKTLASIPFEVILPVVSLAMVYLMLDMPGSFVEWRLWAMALVVALMSMISHNLGLIFGALCMDSVQTASFLAVGFTLPLVLLSGFTARIKHMPLVFQKLSWLSPYRHSTDLINIIRFGFGMCPCDETTDEYLRSTAPEFTDIHPNLKPLLGYYLSNTANNEVVEATTISTISSTNTTEQLLNSTTSVVDQTVKHILGINYDLVLNASERSDIINKFQTEEVDLFARMADMVARSFSYGRQMTGCDSVRSQLLHVAGTPPDDYMATMFGCLFAIMVATKIILFVAVKLKIGSRI